MKSKEEQFWAGFRKAPNSCVVSNDGQKKFHIETNFMGKSFWPRLDVRVTHLFEVTAKYLSRATFPKSA
jgi:hypothetical protein